jgi:hypothetical protein
MTKKERIDDLRGWLYYARNKSVDALSRPSEIPDWDAFHRWGKHYRLIKELLNDLEKEEEEDWDLDDEDEED